MNNSNFLKQNELLNFIRNTQAKSSEQGVKIKCFYITEDMKEFFRRKKSVPIYKRFRSCIWKI